MKQRFITGVIGAIVLVAVLFSNEIVLKIGVTAVAVASVYEVYKALAISKYKLLTVFGMVFSAIFTYYQSLLAIYCLIALLFGYYMFNKKEAKFEEISKTFFSAVFVSFLYSYLILIREMKSGELLIWTIFIISFLTDTFAYLTGRFFGKHKLAPKLSPKKTIEGSIGGFLGAIVGMIVLCEIFKYNGLAPNYLNAVIIAVVGSVVSQLGDLSASAIKRQYGIKDYGNIMPGHGGMMDRFDGVIFTAPLVFYLMTILPII